MVIWNMGVAHGEEVEGEGEEKGQEGEETVGGAFSWKIVATRGGHGIRIKIKMKIRGQAKV